MKDRYTTELADYLEEALPSAWRRTLETDPEFRDRLERLAELEAHINASAAKLPDGAPPSWAEVMAALDARQRRRRLRRFGLLVPAAAALVIAVYWGAAQTPEPEAAVEALIAESQRLERLRFARGVRDASWNEAQLGIAMRIGDVDGEIASLGDAIGAADAERRQGLWQRRVDLLRSLMDQEMGRSDRPHLL